MTAPELAQLQIDNAAFQLSKTLEGVREEDLDRKPVPSMMSIREQSEHLCEVYVAAAKVAVGETHNWGSYKSETTSWPELTELLWSLRNKASTALLSAETDKELKEASAYIVEHDNYHIGQIAAVRLALDSDWDPYSIYR